jgi:hypothetical protein
LSSHEENGEEEKLSSRGQTGGRVAILLPSAEDCDNDNDNDKNNDDRCSNRSWIADAATRLMHVANEYNLPTLGTNQQSLHCSSSTITPLNEGKGMENVTITRTDSTIVDKNELNDTIMLLDGNKDDDGSLTSSSSSLSSSNCRLLLTAVSHPTTNSYALALLVGKQQSQQSQQKQQQQRQQQRMSRVNTNTKQRRGTTVTTDALPYIIDLCPSFDTRLGYRLSSSSSSGGGGELLIKALGLKKMISNMQQQQQTQEQTQQQPIVIYDLTAGFGRDSLVILSYMLSLTSEFTTNNNNNNHHSNKNKDDSDVILLPPMVRLHMMERNPIVGLLLTDAIRRLHLLATAADAIGGIQHDNNNNDDEIQKRKKKKDCVTLQTARWMVQCLSMEIGDSTTLLLHHNKLSSSSLSLLNTTNATTVMEVTNRPPDICYLDPMFPPRKKNKSSAVKKDMAMLHALLLDDDDDDDHVDVDEECDTNNNNDDGRRRRMVIDDERQLLLTAMNIATRRVVVKRPIGALPLGVSSSSSTTISSNIEDDCIAVPKPTYDVRGSTNRFDVYVIS